MNLYEDENNSHTHIKSHWRSWGEREGSTDIGDFVTMCDLSMTTYLWKSSTYDSELLGHGPMCEKCLKAIEVKIGKLTEKLNKYRALKNLE